MPNRSRKGAEQLSVVAPPRMSYFHGIQMSSVKALNYQDDEIAQPPANVPPFDEKLLPNAKRRRTLK